MLKAKTRLRTLGWTILSFSSFAMLRGTSQALSELSMQNQYPLIDSCGTSYNGFCGFDTHMPPPFFKPPVSSPGTSPPGTVFAVPPIEPAMPASSLTMLAMGLQAGESMLSKDLLPSRAEFTMSAWVNSLACFFGLFLRLGHRQWPHHQTSSPKTEPLSRDEIRGWAV